MSAISKTLACLGLVLWVFSWQSCTEPPPLKLTSAQRDQLDTLYQNEVTILASRLDSLCIEMEKSDLQVVVDSLLALRKSQEQNLRKKYQKK